MTSAIFGRLKKVGGASRKGPGLRDHHRLKVDGKTTRGKYDNYNPGPANHLFMFGCAPHVPHDDPFRCGEGQTADAAAIRPAPP